MDLCPVFVVGSLRSGTTLLRLLLDHHPEINIFGEFEAAVSQVKGPGWPNLDEYYEFLEVDRQTLAYNLKIPDSSSYVDLVTSLFNQIAKRSKKKIVGASIHSNIDRIPGIWPDAKFIHLLRDPRDVAKSCIGMGWVGNVYDGASYWLDAESNVAKLRNKIKNENIITVTYEDLITNPVQVLTSICNFLSISYEESMLSLEKDTTYKRPNIKYVSQWRGNLSREEVAWVEARCSKLMASRGYAPEVDPNEYPTQMRVILIRTRGRIKRAIINMNRWGYTNWTLYVVSQRFGPKLLKKRMRLRINKIAETYLK